MEQASRAARRLLGLAPDAEDAEVQALAQEMEWLTCARGETLCQQGEPSDALFYLVSGRAVAIYRDDLTGESRVVSEIRRGETIGEMGMLTSEPRSTSVVCSRDSELLRFDRATFERILDSHPRVLLGISQTVIERLRTVEFRPRHPEAMATFVVLSAGGDDGGLLHSFATSLATALARYGTTRHVAVADLPGGLAEALQRDASEPRAIGWLNDLEHASQYLVLEADVALSNWSERCIRQADRLLLVARSDSDPTPSMAEQHAARLCVDASGTQRDLVLLHPSAEHKPSGTRRWLDLRESQLERHHHVHLGTPTTIERVARFLAGRGVGLALGGGGARGFAHVGVIRALRESGVPIDVVAGTSMGSIIGAESALGWTPADMDRHNREAFIARNPLADYTLPLVATQSGRGASRMLRQLFGDVNIEDLWTTFAAVSSNVTRGSVAAHMRGPVRKYVRASISVPGILPPVPDAGDLLVDGGVLDNLPADIVRGLVGDGMVIAVDVNPRDGLRASEDYGETLDGWEVAWRRTNPFARRLGVPSIQDLLERMTMLSSIQQAAQSVQTMADLYLHPPTDSVRFLDFHAMDAHVRRGYEFARPLVAEWAERTGYAGMVRWSTG